MSLLERPSAFRFGKFGGKKAGLNVPDGLSDLSYTALNDTVQLGLALPEGIDMQHYA